MSFKLHIRVDKSLIALSLRSRLLLFVAVNDYDIFFVLFPGIKPDSA